MIQIGKKIVTIVLVSDLKDEVASSWLQCEIKGDDLNVIENSLSDDLSSLSGKEVLVVLSSKSSLCLHSREASPKDALQELIPGAREEDYYIQKSVSEPTSYEFIHKGDVKTVLSGLGLVKCTKLILESSALKMAFKAVKREVCGVSYKMNLEGYITTVQETTSVQSFELDGNQLSSLELLGLSAVLAAESGSFEEWNEPEEIVSARKGAKETKTLKLVGLGAIAVMLVLSLSNFFLFTHYTDQVNELNKVLFSSNVSISKLEELKNQAAIQEELRSSLNTISSMHGAYLVDKICAEVPTQVKLTKYALEGPSKIKDNKKIEFNSEVIIIRGNTISTIALNQWMQGIETFSEITSVKLISYEDSKEKKGDFEIGITLDDV